MNIARPTPQDLEQAKELNSLLQCLVVYGSFPDDSVSHSQCTTFDINDPLSCQVAMRLIAKAFEHGTGLSRVICEVNAASSPRS